MDNIIGRRVKLVQEALDKVDARAVAEAYGSAIRILDRRGNYIGCIYIRDGRANGARAEGGRIPMRGNQRYGTPYMVRGTLEKLLEDAAQYMVAKRDDVLDRENATADALNAAARLARMQNAARPSGMPMEPPADTFYAAATGDRDAQAVVSKWADWHHHELLSRAAHSAMTEMWLDQVNRLHPAEAA